MGAAVGTATEVDGLLVVVEGVVVAAVVDEGLGEVETPTLVTPGVLDVEVVERELLERVVDNETEALELTAPLGVRYQFAWGSPRHSPAVTPFQPFCLMRLK